MTCLNPNSVEIVRALLEHGADPNCEEGLQANRKSDTSVGREEEEAEREERDEKEVNRGKLKLKSKKNRENGLTCSAAGEEGDSDVEVVTDTEDTLDTEADAAVANGNRDENQPVNGLPVPRLLAGDNPGRPSYTPLHLICSTDTSIATMSQVTPTPQEQVRMTSQL